jgi:histidinol-phosphate/aromatic aminotransferase/cobyric acid decarboxylase-like protein
MLVFNQNLLNWRDSYLDMSSNWTKTVLDVTKWVFPLLPLDQLKEYNQRAIDYILENFWYEYMDLSENWEYHRFKETISKKFSNFWINPNNIVLWHGSFHIVERIFTKALSTWTKILWVWPQFNELPDEFKRMPWNSYETVFEKGSLDYSPRLEMLLDKFKNEDKVSCIYLDNPNNPTWKALDKELVEEIIKVAEQKWWILVLIDEAYWDFLTDEQSWVSFVNSYSNVLVVRSMSKAYWLSRDRIWYAMWNEELIKLINPIFVPFEPWEKSVILWNMVMGENPQLDIWIVAKRKQNFINAISNTDIKTSETNLTVPIITLARNSIYELLARNWIKSVSGKSYNQTHQGMSDSECRIVIPLDEEKQRFIEWVLINN